MLAIRKIINLLTVNLLVLFFCTLIVSISLRVVAHLKQSGSTAEEVSQLNRAHALMAKFPPYKNFPYEKALSMVTSTEKATSTYYPFTGWRRKPYKSLMVNIEPEYRTRLSTNHSVNDSVWFFGGSTMFGANVDDANTIASHYAQISGDDVWNLGEWGYNSYQEFMQLTLLLAKGLRPRLVIFYDGHNDNLYCNTNIRKYPYHGRVNQWTKYIENYYLVKLELRRMQRSLLLPNANSFRMFWRAVYFFFAEPYIDLIDKAFDSSPIGLKPELIPINGKPFKEFSAIQIRYKNCRDSENRTRKAAVATVRTWLLASDLLRSQDIKIKIFLQPTSHLAPNSLNLDYLLDSVKQKIVNESADFKAQYTAIRKVWLEQCGRHNACDVFHDISSIFDGVDEGVYIDAIHLGPSGNRIVAQEILSVIRLMD